MKRKSILRSTTQWLDEQIVQFRRTNPGLVAKEIAKHFHLHRQRVYRALEREPQGPLCHKHHTVAKV